MLGWLLTISLIWLFSILLILDSMWWHEKGRHECFTGDLIKTPFWKIWLQVEWHYHLIYIFCPLLVYYCIKGELNGELGEVDDYMIRYYD